MNEKGNNEHPAVPLTRRSLLQQAGYAASLGAIGTSSGPAAYAQGGDAAAIARLETDLYIHASFGQKFSGGPGDNATANWTANRLRQIGYRVDVSEFDAPYFTAARTEIRLADESEDVFAQAPVLVTGPDGVTGELAVVDKDGVVPDLRRKIAVIVAPFARHAALFPDRSIGATVVAAVDAGAVAVIIVPTGPSGEAVALNSPDNGPFASVPVAVLAPKRAEPVIAAARDGQTGTLVIDGDATRRSCKNIVGKLERGPQWIAVSTPRSGWYQCVAERGTGQAAFLEIAAWLERRYPQHSVFLMNTGAHEYFFAGSHHALEAAPSPERTVAWAHIGATLAARDAVETDEGWRLLDTPDLQRSSMATERARQAVIESFAGLDGYEEPGIVQSQRGELSTFTDMGFTTAFACIGLHRWFHTTADTIETTDARLLLPVVQAHQATLARLIATNP